MRKGLYAEGYYWKMLSATTDEREYQQQDPVEKEVELWFHWKQDFCKTVVKQELKFK